MCCAEESRSKGIDLDYESNTWLQGYRWTCQVAWYPRRFVWKTMDPYKRWFFKSANFYENHWVLDIFCCFSGNKRSQAISRTGWPVESSNRRISGPAVPSQLLHQPLAMIKSGNTRMVLRKGPMSESHFLSHPMDLIFLRSLGWPQKKRLYIGDISVFFQ